MKTRIAYKCDSCGAINNKAGYATRDKTVWSGLPKTWLFFVRNGVVIACCAPRCAEAYIERIG